MPPNSTIKGIWVKYNINAPAGVPTQYLYVNWYVSNDTTNITAIFDYNATTVSYNATWVHNLVMPTSSGSDKYVPTNGCDSALTTPLLPAPSTGEITQAYTLIYAKPPVTYTVNEYPNGSFNYSPYYLNFPATSYTAFPSYFGKYVLPAYGMTTGSTTSLYYATQWLGRYVGGSYNGFNTSSFTYGYIADTVVATLNKPVTTFELMITTNLDMEDVGLINGVLQHPGSSTCELYVGEPLGNWQLVDYMPVYVVVPEGTYIESASLS